MLTPLPCRFCHGIEAKPVPIRVAYATSGVADPVPMWRVQCPCGAIGKCRRTSEEAVASWDEPWQAFVSPKNQGHQPSPELSRPPNAEADALEAMARIPRNMPDFPDAVILPDPRFPPGPIPIPRWPRGHASDKVVSAIEDMRERATKRAALLTVDEVASNVGRAASERLDTWPTGYAERALEAHEEALAQCAEPKPEIDWAERWGEVERLLRGGNATNGVRNAFALMFNWLRDGK